MRNLLQRFTYRMQSFLRGRYGMDQLSGAMVIVSVVCLILANIKYFGILRLLGMALLVFSYLRILSRNIGARRKELIRYQNVIRKFQPKLRLYQKMWQERKTKRYFKCPKCRAMLSVPKGKGKIEITCRVCGEKMIRKS